MRKFFIVTGLILMLTVSLASANYYSWGTSTDTVVEAHVPDRFKAFPTLNTTGGEQGNWYVTYIDYADNPDAFHVKKYDENFIEINSSSYECDPVTSCDEIDCNYASHQTFGNVLECFGASPGPDGQNYFLLRYYYNNDTLGAYLEEAKSGGAAVNFPAVVNDYYDLDEGGLLKMWQRASGEPKFTIEDDPNDDLTGDGVFDLPTGYTSPGDLQVSWCNGNYILFGLYGKNLYALIYDDEFRPFSYNNEPLYYGLENMTPSPTFNMTANNYNVLVDGNIFLLVSTSESTSTDRNISLQSWGCAGDGTISQIRNEFYNMSSYESDTGAISKPYLTKDYNDYLHLFYQINTSGTWYIRQVMSGGCTLGEWYNTSECYQGKRKQSRVVVPSGCDDTSQWIDDYACAVDYNISKGIFEQGVETISDSDVCISEEVDVGEEAVCYNSLTIPYNCVNITVTQESVPVWSDVDQKLFSQWFGGVFTLSTETGYCSAGNYTVSSYVPSTSSSPTEEISNCAYLNATADSSYSSYSAGVTAGGKATLKADGSCQCNYLGLDTYGINKYRVKGILSYECQVLCVAEWRCIDNITEAYIQSDCHPYNETTCPNGLTCNYDTGRCYTYKGEGEGREDTSAYPVNALLNWLYHPNATEKFIMGLLGSLAIGLLAVGVASGLGDGKNGFNYMMGGFAVGWMAFSFIKWINPIYSLVLIFFVVGGFYLKNK